MKMAFKVIKVLFLLTLVLIVLIVFLFGYRDLPLNELKERYGKSPSVYIHVNGMDVHYRDEGNPNDSIPIVLIHGTGASLHTFDHWSTELQKEHRVIRMDLPAYGLTGPFQNSNYSTENYVRFLKSFLDSLGVKKCILGGNSLGGGIAWNFTTEHSSMVERLILIDASGYPTENTELPLAFKLAKIPVVNKIFTFITPRSVVRSSIENVYADDAKITEELIDRYFDLSLRAGNRQAFVDRLSAQTEVGANKKIPSINQRTLILWGSEDLIFPIDQAHKFEHDLRNDTMVIMDGVGHVPMEESPSKSLKILQDFLAKG